MLRDILRSYLRVCVNRILTSLKITFLVTSHTEPAERRADEKDDYVCKRERERVNELDSSLVITTHFTQ